MPDGRTDWETYFAAMPESIRESLGLKDRQQREAKKLVAPPLRLSERFVAAVTGKTTPTPTDEGSSVPAPRRLSSIFAEKG
jgi:hypothetical protein